MKVLFLEDVEGVAHGGDVKEVKRGFAKNYLLPKNIAVIATKASLERIPKLKVEADKNRIQRLNDMKELSGELDGMRVNLPMRSGPTGKLYGSVTNNMIASELSSISSKDIQRRMIVLPESIRQLGLFEISLNLLQEVQANISLLVHPEDVDPTEFEESLSKNQDESETSTDTAEEPDETAIDSDLDSKVIASEDEQNTSENDGNEEVVEEN